MDNLELLYAAWFANEMKEPPQEYEAVYCLNAGSDASDPLEESEGVTVVTYEY
jgi:hypothetical protein